MLYGYNNKPLIVFNMPSIIIIDRYILTVYHINDATDYNDEKGQHFGDEEYDLYVCCQSDAPYVDHRHHHCMQEHQLNQLTICRIPLHDIIK